MAPHAHSNTHRDAVHAQEVCAAAQHILLVDGRQAEAEERVVGAGGVGGRRLGCVLVGVWCMVCAWVGVSR